jgi:protein translocase SecG subunit
MQFIYSILPYIQIVLAVLLVILVILQRSDAGLGSAFGGADNAGVENTRRGFDKFTFYATIIVSILFVIASALALVI